MFHVKRTASIPEIMLPRPAGGRVDRWVPLSGRSAQLYREGGAMSATLSGARSSLSGSQAGLNRRGYEKMG